MAKNAFNTVTKFSKVVALIMFVTFPFLGFYIGMHYQKELDKPMMQEVYEPVVTRPTNVPQGAMCTMEAKQCSDGSYVGRSGPNCEFEKCPGE